MKWLTLNKSFHGLSFLLISLSLVNAKENRESGKEIGKVQVPWFLNLLAKEDTIALMKTKENQIKAIPKKVFPFRLKRIFTQGWNLS